MNRSTRHPALAIAGLALVVVVSAAPSAAAAPFRRADFNQDGRHDVADAVSVLEYLFLAGGGEPTCLDAGDANDDGELDIADALSSLGFLFLGSAAPAAPYPECGVDPTADSLDCDAHRACAVANLSERVGHCGGVPGTAYPNSLAPGDDLHRVTLAEPVAVCNDGSPAVFYIRAAAPDSPAADRWVFYLQGGGGCGSFSDCLDRWCGRQSAVYDESKMSSRYCPDSIGGTGIFRRGAIGDTENAFGDFNQVFLYYCSSDSWSGRNSDAVLTDPEDPELRYSLHFRGHDIVRATIAALLADSVVSDDGVVAMPSLADADFALVTGFSAGSSGVATNGDWVASRLEPQGTVVRLVRDSAFAPPAENHPDPIEAQRLATILRAESTLAWNTRNSSELYDAFVDESGRAALEGSAEEWRLADKSYISHNHITTPTFVRMDLLDRPTLERYAEYGVDPRDLAILIETTLREVPLIATRAVEAAAIARPGGSFGTLCGDHVGLMSDGSFFTRLVDDDSGTPRSYHETLVRWLQGTTVTVVDDPSARSTVCGGQVTENE